MGAKMGGKGGGEGCLNVWKGSRNGGEGCLNGGKTSELG